MLPKQYDDREISEAFESLERNGFLYISQTESDRYMVLPIESTPDATNKELIGDYNDYSEYLQKVKKDAK